MIKMFQINTSTDVYFLQQQKQYPTSRAHEIFTQIVRLCTAARLARRTREIDDGSYYSLSRGIDRDDMIRIILTELDDRVNGVVRFLWKEGSEIVVLDRSNTSDLGLIHDRIWIRILAQRVSWVKNQDLLKKKDMLLRLQVEKAVNGYDPTNVTNLESVGCTVSNNVNVSLPVASLNKNRLSTKRRGRPRKYGIEIPRNRKRGRPKLKQSIAKSPIPKIPVAVMKSKEKDITPDLSPPHKKDINAESSQSPSCQRKSLHPKSSDDESLHSETSDEGHFEKSFVDPSHFDESEEESNVSSSDSSFNPSSGLSDVDEACKKKKMRKICHKKNKIPKKNVKTSDNNISNLKKSLKISACNDDISISSHSNHASTVNDTVLKKRINQGNEKRTLTIDEQQTSLHNTPAERDDNSKACSEGKKIQIRLLILILIHLRQ